MTYGYDVMRTARPDGTVETGERRIDEAEANVVRSNFCEYAAGQSPRAIALKLNRDGIAARPRLGRFDHQWQCRKGDKSYIGMQTGCRQGP